MPAKAIRDEILFLGFLLAAIAMTVLVVWTAE